jgi:hypothetical protein
MKKKKACVAGGGVHKRSFHKKTARRFNRRHRRRDEVAELQYDVQSLCDRDPEMQRLLLDAKYIARRYNSVV